MQLSVPRSRSMLKRDYDQVCSVARSLEVLGERWTLLVIRDIFHGKRRFDADPGGPRGRPQRPRGPTVAAGRGGHPRKRAYQDRPARYEYFLTEKGLDLWPVMVAMMHWGDRWLATDEGPPVVIHPQGVRRPRSTTAATASAAASVSMPATPTPSAAPAWSERRRPRPGSSCRRCPGSRARRRRPGSRRRWCRRRSAPASSWSAVGRSRRWWSSSWRS